MIIRNFNSLSTNSAKKDALKIIEAGLGAANPDLYLEKIVKGNRLVLPGKMIDLARYDRVFVIAVGKAAYSMARSIDLLTSNDGGIVVVPSKAGTMGKKFKILKAGHPIPDKSSLAAAKAILGFLARTSHDDLVIFLISGGSSSLVVMPDGITLGDKQATTSLMLKCGASINEINCVRKHISKVKGGKMMGHLRSDAVSLVMSDVVGDDLSNIASGMTYCDKTTFSDAKKILKKYKLEELVPASVMRHIDLGLDGKIRETPKKAAIKNYVIATNKDCLDAMKSRAQELGFSTKVVRNVSGNVKDLGGKLSKMLPDKKKSCIIFGGESTVAVKGNGKGGRNQELVLHVAVNVSKKGKNAIVASVGTDGIDGNTDAAGAIWQSDHDANDVQSYIDQNNSYNFFKRYGGLIFTGYTGTNLMDIGVVLQK